VLNEHTKLPKSIINKIVDMKLKAVGLYGTSNMMPQELSGGMARRVALARSTALDPELMLFDEPFTGLDPISLQVAAMLIQEFSRALNQTVVLVTHDIKTTLEIADVIYFMEQGKIIESGSPEEIRNTTNAAVRQFIDGNIDGPFVYEYQTKLDYKTELGGV
jgi:phospholipid/cholesterol/gamma-HCH transport system ATP-binding protein